MSTLRKRIRDAVVKTLLDRTLSEDRVFSSRVRPTWGNEFPLILVYGNEEDIEIFEESPRSYKRALSISVEILARANEEKQLTEDLLDSIGEVVEHLMCQDHTKKFLTGEDLCEDTILRGANLSINTEGENAIGSLVLKYEMPYYTLAVRDLEKDAGNFNRMHAEWDVVGDTSGTIHAETDVSGIYDS